MPFKDKTQQRLFQKAWIKARRDAWINANGPCRACGSNKDLEVDHINPAEKLLQPKSLWSLRKELQEAELKKCQVLCADCHAAKTKEHLSSHGISRYRNGCRCDVCKTAKLEISRRSSERRRLLRQR